MDDQFVAKGIGVMAKVGGTPPTLFMLGTSWSRSELRGAKATVRPEAVQIGGVSLGSVAFGPLSPPQAAIPGLGGVLGMDLLGQAALGFDLYGGQLAVWPRGRVPVKDAEVWVRGDSPPEDGADATPVVRVPLARLGGGAPGLSLDVDGRTVTAALTFGLSDSTLLRREAPRPERIGNLPNAGCVISVRVGDGDAAWLGYAPPPNGTEGAYARSLAAHGASALLSLEALGSRRVLIDLAAGAAYVERPSPDDRLTFFLQSVLQAPLAVEGDRIVVRDYMHLKADIGDVVGSEVVRIAGRPAKEWLAALRDGGEGAAGRLARLLRSTGKAYKITVRSLDGTEHDVSAEGTDA